MFRPKIWGIGILLLPCAISTTRVISRSWLPRLSENRGVMLSRGAQSMTITIELPPDLEARFVAEAKSRGVSVGEVVKAYLYHAPPEPSPKQLTAGEVDRGLEEAADLIPEGI